MSRSSAEQRDHWRLFAGAVLIEACLLSLHWYPPEQIPVVRFVWHILLAFAVYATVLPVPLRRPASKRNLSLPLILGCGLVFRLTMLLLPPIWDDDLYRYVWDGRVGLQGINPYSYAPEAPELENLQDDHYDLISFKNIRTIYPPLLQFVFQLSQWIAPSSFFFLKCLSLCFELALIAVLISLLRILQYPPAWILMYVWNPLPIKEFANSGHMDSMVLFLLFLALRFLINQRIILAHLTLSLSVLAKGFTGIALPFFLFANFRKGRASLWKSVALVAAVLFLGHAPFADAGTRVFEGLLIYSRYWNFNAGPFWVIEQALKVAGWDSWWLSRVLILAGVIGVLSWQLIALWRGRSYRCSTDTPFSLPPGKADRAKGARGSIGFVVAHPCLISPLCASQDGEKEWLPVPGQSISLMKAVFHSLAALVLLSPTVQPWYICWLIPFFVFFPRVSWPTLSALAVLSYLFYVDFAEWAWPRSIEFGIPALIAGWEWRRNENYKTGHSYPGFP